MFRKPSFGRGKRNDQPAPSGPKRPQIPQAMKDEISRNYGANHPNEGTKSASVNGENEARFKSQRTVMSRKDRRKLEKVQKKQKKNQHYDRIHGRGEPVLSRSNNIAPQEWKDKGDTKQEKKRKREEDIEEIDSDEFGSDIDEDNPMQKHTRLTPEPVGEYKPKKQKTVETSAVSSKASHKLERFTADSAADDAMMRDLEKKLGIKKGKGMDEEYGWILGGLSAGSGKLLVEDAPDLKSYMKNKKKSLVDDEDVGLVDELTGDAPEVISFKSKISPQAKKAGKAAPAPYEDSEEEVVSEFSDEESGEPDYDINDSEDDFGLGVDDGSSEDFEEEGEEMGEDFELDDEQDLSGEVGSEDEFGLGADDGSDMEGLEEIYGDGKLEAMMELASGDDEDAGEMSDEIDGDDIEESNGDDDGDGELAAESRETGDGDEETEDKPAVGAASKYVPPHLRKLQQTSEDPKTAQMRKELRGLINRLGEGNLLKVAQSIEELYRYNSRNATNEAFSDFLIDDCLQSVGAAQVFTFTMVYGALVAILQSTIGPEVGGTLLDKLAREFEKRFNSIQENATAINKNILLMFVYLFNFKVIHASIMYDIANKLAARFHENDLDMLLLMIKNCGSSLRADDPAALKDFIQAVNAKASDAKAKKGAIVGGITRVDFMLETLADLKNNKLKMQDKDSNGNVLRIRKQLENHLKERYGSYTAPDVLKITWEDLTSDKKIGRWWQLGSAFQMGSSIRQDIGTNQSDNNVNLSIFSEEVLALAKQQKMNTDVRRAIFCILMTSEDYLDAFEKLMKLQLKNKQDREIVSVVLHCVQQENKFNPFYAHLARQLCSFHKNNGITLKFALWDKLKLIDELPVRAVSNIAKFYSQLFSDGSLSLAALKSVEWDSLTAKSIVFLRVLFSSLFLEHDVDSIEGAFRRIAGVSGLEQMKDGLTLFFIQSLLPAEASEEKMLKLRTISKIARKAMKTPSGSMF